jgi:hypothetical protein
MRQGPAGCREGVARAGVARLLLDVLEGRVLEGRVLEGRVLEGLAPGGLALRAALLGGVVLGGLLLEGNAVAAEDPPVVAEPAVRRTGMAIGISTGLALSAARGYPNDVAKIDLPEFEASTGAGVSPGGALWLGGSLADWLTIAVGLAGGSFEGNGLSASSGTFHVRIETFPLFYRGGAWQDLGLTFMAGTGWLNVKRDAESVAEGEGTSAVGVGAFYEPWRFWQFSTGPDLSYTHQFSRSMSAHQVVLGWRLAYYGGP